MLSFVNDYSCGAHEKVLEALCKINLEPNVGYGMDPYSERAKEKIRAACNCPDAEIFFLVGGTQTNQVVIDTMLQPYEGVVAATTGHVALHEAGAIEYSGHKVLTLPHHDGKVDAGDLRQMLKLFYADDNHEHMVFPGMVYVSHPTENGTLYTKKELSDIAEICHEYEMPLFLDGARLGYGLASEETDLTLEDIARLCDVFYIGGTKVGALFGEAVVFTKKNMPRHFVAQVKQHGALLAKGFLLGVQFDALFTDGLYQEIGRHAMEMAKLLKEVLTEKGCVFHQQSPTNQQYIVVENGYMKELEKKVRFSFWETVDDEHTAIRFVTSWATKKEDVLALREIL